MRKILAAIQTSLDGYVEGANGEVDWIEDWKDPFDLLDRVDTFILGGGMCPGYEQYWRAIVADPKGDLPFTAKGDAGRDRIRPRGRPNAARGAVDDARSRRRQRRITPCLAALTCLGDRCWKVCAC
jgi:hypothetical protein